MKVEDFELRETLAREDLEQHAVWAPFRAGDRALVLGWGVPAERLDEQLERYGYCGPEPLFPWLAPAPLPPRPDWILAAVVETPGGPRLPGYCIGSDVVGLFAAGREWVFNRGLPSRIPETATRLSEALGVPGADVLPLHVRTVIDGLEASFRP